MAFREKLSWTLLTTVIVGYVIYWWAVLGITSEVGWRAPVWALVPPLIGMCVWMTILAIVGASAAALSAPREANAPADERDRTIARRASTRAYSVLTTGIGVLIVLSFLDLSRLQLVHVLVSLLVAAEAIRYASEAWQYRRGE